MEPLDYFRMRRATFYGLTTEHSDNFEGNDVPVVISHETLVQDACDYIRVNKVGEMRYPGKSYAIAILYAHWLEQLGVGCLWHNLEMSDLLGNDDPHFKHLDSIDEFFSPAWSPYEAILDKLEYNIPDLHCTDSYSNNEYLMMTREYFLNEFMLTKEQRELLPFVPDWDISFNFGKDFPHTADMNAKLQDLYSTWLSDSPQVYLLTMDKKSGFVNIGPVNTHKLEVYVGPGVFISIPQSI